MKPLPVLDRRPLALTKRGICFCGQVYVFFLRHMPEHITSNMTIFPRLSSLYFSPPVSLYFSSVSAGSLASTGSPNCTRSQPSLLFRSRIIRPLWGKLVYFWVGLTRYKPYWVLFFFNALALPFPHIYLMLPPFISFRHFQFLTLLSLPCHVGITDTWAPFLSFHTNSQTTGSMWVKGCRRTDLTEIFSILSSLPPPPSPFASTRGSQQTVGGRSVIAIVPGSLLSLVPVADPAAFSIKPFSLLPPADEVSSAHVKNCDLIESLTRW